MLYTFEINSVNIDKLQSELNQYTQKVTSLTFTESLLVETTEELTVEELNSVALIVENHNPLNIVQAVTPRQMRIALIMAGINLSVIESMIEALPEPDKSITRITWEYSVEFQRNNPLLNAMAPALGLTQEQVDNLFQLASTL